MLQKIKEALREELNKLYAYRDNAADNRDLERTRNLQRAIDQLVKAICEVDQVLFVYGE